MRYKHNKKRNTAFLFEALTRELTSSILSKQKNRKDAIISIIKENFSPRSILSHELQIYKSLVDAKFSSYHIAEKVLSEAKSQYGKIDEKRIFNLQSKLISDINKKLGKNVYSSFVPNYKSLANIYQYFNTSMPPKTKVLLESSIVKHMCGDQESINENVRVPADKLVLKTFIEKFNETYSDVLFEEQKQLLSKFVGSFADNGLDLKIYLNEEIPRLRGVLEENLKKPEFKLSDPIQAKAEKVLGLIDGYRQKEINTTVVEQVLKIQNLAREIIQ